MRLRDDIEIDLSEITANRMKAVLSQLKCLVAVQSLNCQIWYRFFEYLQPINILASAILNDGFSKIAI